MNIRDYTSGHGNVATSTLALAVLAWDLKDLRQLAAAAVLRLHSRFVAVALRLYADALDS